MDASHIIIPMEYVRGRTPVPRVRFLGAQKQTGTSAGYIQSQETNITGIVAELIECKRKEGVLTVKVRFRNTSNNKAYIAIDTHHCSYEGFYISAENKKYFVLKDSDGAPLAPKYIGENLEKSQIFLWCRSMKSG